MKFKLDFDTGSASGTVSFATIDDTTRFLQWLRGDQAVLILEDGGQNKIQAIKLVREITNLGLRESKDLVESVPKQVGGFMSVADAARLVQRFGELGARARAGNGANQ